MLVMDKLLIMIIQTKRAKTKLLLLCLVLKFLLKPKSLLLNYHILVLIPNQVHHHHHHHLLYLIVSVEIMMNAVVIERDLSQSLGIDPHLNLGLLFLVLDLRVIMIMNDVHIRVDRWRNYISIIIVIDNTIILHHLILRINNNPILCLLFQTVSVYVSFMYVCF